MAKLVKFVTSAAVNPVNAMVPIAYGLRPLGREGLGLPFDGGIRFREFAFSSVAALALAMGLYDVFGIVAIIVTALSILGLRLWLSRRIGGVSGHALATASLLCELALLASLAALTKLSS